jgi:hypothetical protein
VRIKPCFGKRSKQAKANAVKINRAKRRRAVFASLSTTSINIKGSMNVLKNKLS